jgi:hypothetical protein
MVKTAEEILKTEADPLLLFRRVEILDVSTALGCAERSYVTGEIDFKRMRKYPDYNIVDIYDRVRPPPTLNGCKRDKYMFKAYPMSYRTWLYHSVFQRGIITKFGTNDENHLVRHVLSQSAIDAPTINGLGSPLPAYVPLSFGATLLGNNFAVLGALVFIWLLRKLWVAVNTPEHYKYARLVTLPFRCAFLGILLAVADVSDMMGLAGLVLVVGAWIFDFVIGDIMNLLTIRLNCSYEIQTPLGNRTYICWRNGAMGLEETFGDTGRIHESVCGMASWERCHTLIADIGDILVELRPMTESDWDDAREKFMNDGYLTYICTKVFQPINQQTLDHDYMDYDGGSRGGDSGFHDDMRLEDC